jgi:hypothetical protein
MPFISKFSGHGRVPGIHKPEAPPTPTLSATASTINSLTFTINNYVANWTYVISISPSAGTISRTDGTVSVTGLNSSTTYTLTVTARNSGGEATNTVNGTTGTPPPFFPSFAPFFPFFPSFPFFPFFPSFPFFPFFPSFPSFPFFPNFVRPGPAPVKTAPSAALSDIQSIQILTSEYGYLDAKYLTEEDKLKSYALEGIGTNKVNIIEDIDTEIIKIDSHSDVSNIYFINNEGYSSNCYLLCRRNDIIDFINVKEISESDKIFNYENKDFVDIKSYRSESVSGIIYNIECLPINYYVIHSSLGYFK